LGLEPIVVTNLTAAFTLDRFVRIELTVEGAPLLLAEEGL
jgi:hypothetical protein